MIAPDDPDAESCRAPLRPVAAGGRDRLPALHLRQHRPAEGCRCRPPQRRPVRQAVADRYGIDEHDRFSQTFDMTFDLSVFDMFVAWERGACVCCPSERELMAPGPLHPRLTADRLVLGSLGRRLHAPAEDAEARLLSEPPLEPVLRRAAPRRAGARLGGGGAGLDRREPLRADRGDHRLHGPAPRPATIAAEEVNGVVPIGEPIGEMRALVVDERAAGGRARLRWRAARGRAPGHTRLLGGRGEDGGRVRDPAGPRGDPLPHRGSRAQAGETGRAALLPRPPRPPDQGSRPSGRAGRGRGGASRGVGRRRRDRRRLAPDRQRLRRESSPSSAIRSSISRSCAALSSTACPSTWSPVASSCSRSCR